MRPRTVLIDGQPRTLREVAALQGLTPQCVYQRLQRWPLARVLGEEPCCTTRMGRAIAAYYAAHPDETPPWERTAPTARPKEESHGRG